MNTPRTQTSLTAKKLSIGYKAKDKSHTTIAHSLDLQLEQGQLICLLGPNGAGKSTLIRTLCGMAAPLSGEVKINDHPLSQLSPKERARTISVVLTDPMSIGMLSVTSLVALGRHPHTNWTGNLSPHDHKKVEWALNAVNAQDLAHRSIGELSDGERQKVMIARALAQEAPIMLLDEPTAFLDLTRRVELMRLLRDLAHRENLSILLSTHDLDLALRCADQLWLFNDHGDVHTGPPEELALTGAIAKSFASDKLDWDLEQGSFRMHREPCTYVTLQGQSPAATWTRRALARLGYGITTDQNKAAFQINLNTPDNWQVTYSQTTQNFSTLKEFTTWLQNFNTH